MDDELVLQEVRSDPPREEWIWLLGNWSGLSVPRRIESTWSGKGFKRVVLKAVVGPERYDVESLEVDAEPRSGSLTTARLRWLSLQSMSEEAARRVLDWEGSPPASFRRNARRAIQQMGESRGLRGPSREVLGLAAALFRFGGLVGEPPAELVSRVFEVSLSTAGNWIRRAKDLGYLQPFIAIEMTPGTGISFPAEGE